MIKEPQEGNISDIPVIVIKMDLNFKISKPEPLETRQSFCVQMWRKAPKTTSQITSNAPFLPDCFSGTLPVVTLHLRHSGTGAPPQPPSTVVLAVTSQHEGRPSIQPQLRLPDVICSLKGREMMESVSPCRCCRDVPKRQASVCVTTSVESHPSPCSLPSLMTAR